MNTCRALMPSGRIATESIKKVLRLHLECWCQEREPVRPWSLGAGWRVGQPSRPRREQLAVDTPPGALRSFRRSLGGLLASPTAGAEHACALRKLLCLVQPETLFRALSQILGEFRRFRLDNWPQPLPNGISDGLLKERSINCSRDRLPHDSRNSALLLYEFRRDCRLDGSHNDAILLCEFGRDRRLDSCRERALQLADIS